MPDKVVAVITHLEPLKIILIIDDLDDIEVKFISPVDNLVKELKMIIQTITKNNINLVIVGHL